MKAPSSHARLWQPWTDYTTGCFQFTATELVATFATAIASVALAFAGPYIFRIILSSLDGLTFLSSEQSYDEDDETGVRHVEDGELERPLLSANVGDVENESARAYGTMASDNPIENGPRSSSKKVYRVRDVFQRLIIGGGALLTTVWGFAAVLWVILVVHTIGFEFTERNAGDAHLALWNSPTCGVFESANPHDNKPTIRTSDLAEEQRAGAYAKACYENSPEQHPETSCSFFVLPYIGNDEKRWNTCPFLDNGACLNREWSPFVNFDTLQGHDIYDGSMKRYIYKNASDLGINVAKPYRWKRGTSCVPLSMEYPYVRENTDESGVTTYYYRHLQPVDNSSDFVWSTRGDPFEEKVAGYTLRAFTTHYNLSLDNETYKTYPGINPFYQSRLTVIYISAGRVLYEAPSADPLFPADTPYTYDNVTYYRKSDPKATALACADINEVCDEWFCQHISEPFSWREDKESKVMDLWWMKQALRESSAYHAVSAREGDALIASELVREGVSPRLGDDHWIQEARRMFNTSLAHAQFTTWDIANGVGNDVAEYADKPPPAFKDELCRSFKFRAEGTRNVPLWPLVLCVLAWPVAFVLSWRLESVRSAVRNARSAILGCFGGRRGGAKNGKGAARSVEEGNGEASTGLLASQDAAEEAEHRGPEFAETVTWQPLLFHWLFVLGPLYLTHLAFWLAVAFVVGHIAIVHRIIARKGWPGYSLTVWRWVRESASDVVWWFRLLVG